MLVTDGEPNSQTEEVNDISSYHQSVVRTRTEIQDFSLQMSCSSYSMIITTTISWYLPGARHRAKHFSCISFPAQENPEAVSIITPIWQMRKLRCWETKGTWPRPQSLYMAKLEHTRRQWEPELTLLPLCCTLLPSVVCWNQPIYMASH